MPWGVEAKADGQYSAALGRGANTTVDYATAAGYYATASGSGSVALGAGSTATELA